MVTLMCSYKHLIFVISYNEAGDVAIALRHLSAVFWRNT
jgi:hypothetical protein